MKKIFLLLYLLIAGTNIWAQIYEPVKWLFEFRDLPSAEKEIVFKAIIEPGWHLYDMSLPDGGPVSTSISFESLQGAELIGKPVASVAPTEVFDKQFDMNLRWYANSVSFTQKIKVTNHKRFKASGVVEFMACNDETCIPPDRVPFSFDRNNIKNISEEISQDTLPIDLLSEGADVESDSLPGDVADDVELKEVSLPGSVRKETGSNDFVQSIQTEDVSLWAPVIDELKALGDKTTSATDRSFIYIFIAGFLGGLLALLTPCV